MGGYFKIEWMSRALVLAVVVLFSLSAPWLSAQDNPNPPPDGGSHDNVSFQTFYDSLANQGTWIQSPDYGYVWQPTVTDNQWAPYTDGHWVFTEDGWTWVSGEPWGWATYHYGRWVNLDGVGWCWVPGYTWAPAWVSWRYGDGYCGWAPLPPDSLVGIDFAYGPGDFGDGFHIGGDCDSYFGIGAGWYNFLPIAYFGDADYRGYYANRHDNYRLINRTTNVTNLNVNRGEAGGSFGGVNLGGPSLLQVNARSQTPVQRVGLAFTERVGGGAVNGNSLAIFAPRVDVNTLQAARPPGTVRAFGHMEINRGTDLSRPLLVSSRLASPAPTPREIQEARNAQATAPTSAKIATLDGGPSRFHSTPILTSMHPLGFSGEDRPSSLSGSVVRPLPTRSNESPLYNNSGLYRPGTGSRSGFNEEYSRPMNSIYSRPTTSGPSSDRGPSGTAGASGSPRDSRR